MYQTLFHPSLIKLNSKHLTGILLFGLPLFIFRSEWMMLLKPPQFSVFSLIVFYVLFLLTSQISILSAMNKLKKMPALTPVFKSLDSLLIIYIMIRSTFLIIYECFFRGLLLLSCTQFLGFAAALCINLLLYMGVHASCDRRELIACLPFGITTCLLVAWLHSIWPAIILHLALSNIHETYLFYSPN
jgi:hypothetical protein